MARSRTILPALAGWEAVRLFALIVFFSSAFAGVLVPGNAMLIHLLIALSGHLLTPAGALYLFFTRTSSPPLLLILAAAKILAAVTVLLGAAAAAIEFIPPAAAGRPDWPLLFRGLILCVIFLADLIFAVLLLSLKGESGRAA